MWHFFGRFFRQTSNVNISETVYPNDLKFNLERDMIWDYSQLKFQFSRINRFRDIDVGSWPKKATEKKSHFFGPSFINFNPIGTQGHNATIIMKLSVRVTDISCRLGMNGTKKRVLLYITTDGVQYYVTCHHKKGGDYIMLYVTRKWWMFYL